MKQKRMDRVTSLLKEVLSELIQKEVKDPRLAKIVTITNIEIEKDLSLAHISVSVYGSEKEKEDSIKALNSAAGFLAIKASKEVILKFFPSLTFKLDRSLENQEKIETILNQLKTEKR